MQADEFQSLKDSITNVGVQNPITLFEGMVLDGWHRYRAALEVVQPCPSKLLGDVDPADFVAAQNDARRNLNASQRALAVSAIYAWKPTGQPKKSAPGADLSELKAQPEKSAVEMAAIARVGTRTMEQAKAVNARASTDVKAAVESGAMSVKKAAATLKPAKQKPAPIVAVVAAIPPEDDQGDAVAILSEENDRLNDRLATVAMNATEDERAAALKTITDLRAETKNLSVNKG
jgi:hypothetical protein